MNLFRRSKPQLSSDQEKVEAERRLIQINQRVEQLRNEAAVITIRIPKQKRAN